MEKVKPNCILLIFATLFILAGMRRGYWTDLCDGLKQVEASSGKEQMSALYDIRTVVDNVTDKSLYYHDTMMDIDSLRNNIMGTRVIEKDDTVVVKSKSGSLVRPIPELTDQEIEEVEARIADLKKVTEDNGAKFLYCIAPGKELYETEPENVENYYELNISRLKEGLKEKGIPALDLSETEEIGSIPQEERFYYTDHHWTTRTGLSAVGAICGELSEKYGFEYDREFTDISNYNVRKYPDWFLGSKGKKVGTYFTWRGTDDFDLITPAFETSLTESQPFKDEERQGSFEDTVLYMQRLEKDYYKNNTYATYCGGDYRLQIITNHLKPDGDKVLLIRDSFACVVAPFLALQTGELHICDMRNYSYFVGDKLNMEEYIKEIKPQYVIVLYSGIDSLEGSAGRYDFF